MQTTSHLLASSGLEWGSTTVVGLTVLLTVVIGLSFARVKSDTERSNPESLSELLSMLIRRLTGRR